MRLLSFCFAGILMASSAVTLQAQAPAGYQCTGSTVRVRISEIKPGMMPTFLKAVDAQSAYYEKVSPGTHKITLGRVTDLDRASGTLTLSETRAITYHVYPAGPMTQQPQDAGYAAFVKMFQESSTIKEDYLTCMAKM